MTSITGARELERNAQFERGIMSSVPRNLAVMVVDDDPAIRRLIRKILEEDGFRVLECATGAEASRRLFSEEWHILLLDLTLGDLDCKTICQAVKGESGFAGRHVIIVSADDDPLQKVALLDTGADDYVTKPFHPAELVARVRAGARLVDMQQKLLVLNAALAHSTNVDGLTQLFNHNYFQGKLTAEFHAAARYGHPLSIAMIDIDSFKRINDTYGHAVGDRALRQFAKVLLAETRSSDVAARYGGDEFALVLRETALEAALLCATRIATAARAIRIPADDTTVKLTVSIGLAALPHRRIQSSQQVLEYADRALYRAKRNGRNQVQAWGRPAIAQFANSRNTSTATLSFT